MSIITRAVSGLTSTHPSIPYWRRDRSPTVSSISWATPTAWATARLTHLTATPPVQCAASKSFWRTVIPARQTVLQMTRRGRPRQTHCGAGLSEEGADSQWDFTNRRDNPDLIRAKPGYQSLLDWADELLQMARNQQLLTHRVSFSPASMELTVSGDYFVGTTKVTLQNCSGGYTLDKSSLPLGYGSHRLYWKERRYSDD